MGRPDASFAQGKIESLTMDWLRFFDDHGVDYATRGPNVKHGNVNIACPMCGDDPSHHMGVSLEGDKWGCWRSADHVGRKPKNLIKHILGCSYNQAKIIEEQYSAADPENLDEALESLLIGEQTDSAPVKRKRLKFRPEFKTIVNKGTTRRFWQYLKGRGFNDVDLLVELYSLKCASTGDWKDRVIVPIYSPKGKVLSWTSRAIGVTHDAPRYLALSEEAGGLVNVFHTLWNMDVLQEGNELLMIVEGPFDAMKVDYYGMNHGCSATCTFGTSMSEEQAMMIAEASKNFSKTVLLYDAGATAAIFRAKELLGHTNVECGFLPENIEDPGAMSKKQVLDLINYLF